MLKDDLHLENLSKLQIAIWNKMTISVISSKEAAKSSKMFNFWKFH